VKIVSTVSFDPTGFVLTGAIPRIENVEGDLGGWLPTIHLQRAQAHM